MSEKKNPGEFFIAAVSSSIWSDRKSRTIAHSTTCGSDIY